MDDYLCQVKVTNNVEGAVIDEVVCTFYFESGDPYVNDQDIDIGYHETRYVTSNTNSRPTKRVTTVIKVVYHGQVTALTNDTGDAGAGYYWVLIPLELNPASLLSTEKLKNAKSSAERLAARFKCGTVDPKTGERVQRDWGCVEDFDEHVKKFHVKRH